MNERFTLNAELIRTHLDKEHRKISWLERELNVSASLVAQMLSGHVPKLRTVKRLADLLGVEERQLLLPKKAA